MKLKGWTGIMATAFLLTLVGCEKETGPDLVGNITLSSQLYGTESYYLNGFSFEDGAMYAYPSKDDPEPDIINEGYLIMDPDGEEQISVPGFNTPGFVNGFALVGAFSNLTDAEAFYNNYAEVEEDLNYETVSDFVEEFQVWVQWTSSGKYVKMLIRDIQQFESEKGSLYNEVSLEYTYAADGSSQFN